MFIVPRKNFINIQSPFFPLCLRNSPRPISHYEFITDSTHCEKKRNGERKKKKEKKRRRERKKEKKRVWNFFFFFFFFFVQRAKRLRSFGRSSIFPEAAKQVVVVVVVVVVVIVVLRSRAIDTGWIINSNSVHSPTITLSKLSLINHTS